MKIYIKSPLLHTNDLYSCVVYICRTDKLDGIRPQFYNVKDTDDRDALYRAMCQDLQIKSASTAKNDVLKLLTGEAEYIQNSRVSYHRHIELVIDTTTI